MAAVFAGATTHVIRHGFAAVLPRFFRRIVAMSHSNDIFLVADDVEALALMLSDPIHARLAGDGVDVLIDVLSLARVVAPDALDNGVVAMGSHVTYEEMPSGEQRRVTLAYPINADPARGRISVLSPVGRALLGRSTGTVVSVNLPSGAITSLLIRNVRPAVQHEEECHA